MRRPARFIASPQPNPNGTTARVLQAEPARAALIRGSGAIATLLETTLGPAGRAVAVAPLVGGAPPELLTDGATIARRVVEVGDSFTNMGAMLLRQVAWQMAERVGDGAATAGVVAHVALREALEAVARGGHVDAIRAGLRQAAEAVQSALVSRAKPLDGAAALARLVNDSVGEWDVAYLVGEAVDAVGPEGYVEVIAGRRAATTVEFVDGARWSTGIWSTYLFDGAADFVRLLDARVLAVDHAVDSADHLASALACGVGAGGRSLLVIAPTFSEAAVNLLATNHARGVLHTVPVRAPGHGGQQLAWLEDIAALTGGRVVSQARAERLDRIDAAWFGRARHAWADTRAFGLAGGQPKPGALARHLTLARADRRAAEAQRDVAALTASRERIARLLGAHAVVRVGGFTESERAARQRRVEAAVRAAQLALAHGVAPGGGSALLAGEAAITRLRLSGDAAVGAAALARSLSAPIRAIVANAGREPQPLLAEARRRGGSWAYDVLCGAWVDAGLVDPLPLPHTAIELALSLATPCLSLDTLVRRREPPVALNP